MPSGPLLQIVQAGHPVLRQPARELAEAEYRSQDFAELADQMRETMHAAPGVGLAAPQVAMPLRLAVMEDPPEFVEALADESAAVMERQPHPYTLLINPTLQPASDGITEFFEGCLSVDGYRALVPRYRQVHLRWLDIYGQQHDELLTGWPARIAQHELDHLDGILYIDRMVPRSLMTHEEWQQRWHGVPIAEVRAALGMPSTSY